MTREQAQQRAEEILANELDQIAAPLIAKGRRLPYDASGFELVRAYFAVYFGPSWKVEVDAGTVANKRRGVPRVTVTHA